MRSLVVREILGGGAPALPDSTPGAGEQFVERAGDLLAVFGQRSGVLTQMDQAATVRIKHLTFAVQPRSQEKTSHLRCNALTQLAALLRALRRLPLDELHD